MTDIEKARTLFQDAGLAFPTIPEELAARLREQGDRRLAMRNNIGDLYGPSWLFSTREIDMSPYNLQQYVREAGRGPVDDYVILSHSGHGVNSYALQYYLVYKALRMFLHLGWGGVYMDAEADAIKIRDCFSLSDEIITTLQDVVKIPVGDRLTIVGSDSYGSYWSLPGENRHHGPEGTNGPAVVLTDALHWLRTP